MSKGAGYVVIGAGQAGACAVETMREEGYDGPITLIGQEPHLPYERPPLSKEVLRADPDFSMQPIRDAGWYAENEVELCLETTVASVSAAEKRVICCNGRTIPYAGLLLATGGELRKLSVPGANLANVRYLRTIDDARALRDQLAEGRHLVVVGGGFIGLEVAASARQRGAEVSIVEASGQLMGRIVPTMVGNWIASRHEAAGVSIHFNRSVTRIEGGTAVDSVVLSDGTILRADIVVVGIGIRPATALAEEAGLTVDDGIVTDAFCRTSDPYIYAAGDAARAYHKALGRAVRLESWQNAQHQGATAARAMCGNGCGLVDIPWFWSNQYDVKLQIVGFPTDWDDCVMRGDPEDNRFILFRMDHDRVVGAIGISASRDALLAKRIIDSGISVSRKELANQEIKLKRILNI